MTFGYNNNMLPVSVAGTSTYAQTIAYDSAMRMIQLVRGANKLNSVYDYNDWNVDGGRLQNLTTTRPADSVTLQNITYDYDVVGNINTIADSNGATPPVAQTQTFAYDELDRLLSSNVTGGTNGIYAEGYTYETSTGNLKTKGNGTPNTYTYDTTHKHAVASLSNGNSYGYDDNGNMTSRHVLEGTTFKDFTLNYDAENRLVSVTGAATANFYYDADGKQVKATVNGTTTVYVGNHYEVKSGVVSKYYFAGATRLAVRTGTTLSYLLSDHLGSSSVTTDANGVKSASALYKAFGETRYTLGNLGTDYKFTGQREEAALGIYYFNARWYDGSLGRFLSPDTTIPQSQGTQAYDRYAYVNNNPIKLVDINGHEAYNVTFDSKALNYFNALFAIEITAAQERRNNAMIVGGIIGAGLGVLAGGLCLVGAIYCSAFAAVVGAVAGAGIGYLAGGGSYASDLENTVNQINLGVSTAQLNGDTDPSVFFYSADDGYYVRLPDGTYLQVSEDVFNTLKQVYSSPLPENEGHADFEDEKEILEELEEEYCQTYEEDWCP